MCQDMSIMSRLKTPISTAIDPDLLGRLDAWIAKQEFPPSKTIVWETALRDFLDRREKRK